MGGVPGAAESHFLNNELGIRIFSLRQSGAFHLSVFVFCARERKNEITKMKSTALPKAKYANA
jgi:hypothetical protein